MLLVITSCNNDGGLGCVEEDNFGQYISEDVAIDGVNNQGKSNYKITKHEFQVRKFPITVRASGFLAKSTNVNKREFSVSKYFLQNDGNNIDVVDGVKIPKVIITNNEIKGKTSSNADAYRPILSRLIGYIIPDHEKDADPTRWSCRSDNSCDFSKYANNLDPAKKENLGKIGGFYNDSKALEDDSHNVLCEDNNGKYDCVISVNNGYDDFYFQNITAKVSKISQFYNCVKSDGSLIESGDTSIYQIDYRDPKKAIILKNCNTQISKDDIESTNFKIINILIQRSGFISFLNFEKNNSDCSAIDYLIDNKANISLQNSICNPESVTDSKNCPYTIKEANLKIFLNKMCHDKEGLAIHIQQRPNVICEEEVSFSENKPNVCAIVNPKNDDSKIPNDKCYACEVAEILEDESAERLKTLLGGSSLILDEECLQHFSDRSYNNDGAEVSDCDVAYSLVSGLETASDADKIELRKAIHYVYNKCEASGLGDREISTNYQYQDCKLEDNNGIKSELNDRFLQFYDAGFDTEDITTSSTITIPGNPGVEECTQESVIYARSKYKYGATNNDDPVFIKSGKEMVSESECSKRNNDLQWTGNPFANNCTQEAEERCNDKGWTWLGESEGCKSTEKKKTCETVGKTDATTETTESTTESGYFFKDHDIKKTGDLKFFIASDNSPLQGTSNLEFNLQFGLDEFYKNGDKLKIIIFDENNKKCYLKDDFRFIDGILHDNNGKKGLNFVDNSGINLPECSDGSDSDFNKDPDSNDKSTIKENSKIQLGFYLDDASDINKGSYKVNIFSTNSGFFSSLSGKDSAISINSIIREIDGDRCFKKNSSEKNFKCTKIADCCFHKNSENVVSTSDNKVNQGLVGKSYNAFIQNSTYKNIVKGLFVLFV
ncbi:hypothetical protein N9C35_04360, partial [Flavobacteriaceae bacterium]|nr:hypothetical protein [Flavobacteriaceae bacterium]